MKKIDVGQAVAVLANVGVIAGIMFLAIELRLNTRAVEAQTRDSITEKQMQLYAWQATNSDLSSSCCQGEGRGCRRTEYC